MLPQYHHPLPFPAPFLPAACPCACVLRVLIWDGNLHTWLPTWAIIIASTLPALHTYQSTPAHLGSLLIKRSIRRMPDTNDFNIFSVLFRANIIGEVESDYMQQ